MPALRDMILGLNHKGDSMRRSTRVLSVLFPLVSFAAGPVIAQHASSGIIHAGPLSKGIVTYGSFNVMFPVTSPNQGAR